MIPLSNCCQAILKIVGSTDIKNYWQCSKCGQPCDPVRNGECPHAQMGQRYDERRGVGNGPVICFGCGKTIHELLAESRRRAIEECITEIRRMERELETRDVNTFSIITKLEGMK